MRKERTIAVRILLEEVLNLEEELLPTFDFGILFVESSSSSSIVINKLYRAAILRAINELKDMHLRSKANDIRSHVQSSLQPVHNWNDTIFVKTLKSLVSDGDIEQFSLGNYALSSQFKAKRTQSMERLWERDSAVSCVSPEYSSHLATKSIQGRFSPVRKQEHAKQKIIPKKIYDSLQ